MSSSKPDNTIVELNAQLNAFILSEEDLHPNLFGFHFVQVDAAEKCFIYRDGVLYKQLNPGPYRWWNGFLHKWKKQRINMRIETLEFSVKGRVRGPSMPKDIPGATAVDLACDVTAEIDLVCRLSDVQTFLQYRTPLTVFDSSIRNMIVEMIGKLPYDQLGDWVVQLRDSILDRLTGTGRGNAERLVGIRVEDVLVREFKPNTAHDRNMIANYQLVERIRREAAEAEAKAGRDKVAAESFREQGERLNIAPSILALKDSAIGSALIENDANLRKISIAAGLNPGVNIQPIQEPANQLGMGQAVTGYLNLPSPRGPSGQNIPPAIQQASGAPYPPYQQTSGPLYPLPQQVSSPLYPLQTSGTFSPESQQQPSAPFNFVDNTNPAQVSSLQNASPMDDPVDPARQARELAALQQNGFETGGKVTPVYDQSGNPIPNTKEWVLQVAAPRGNGYLLMVFHCPSGYPQVAPSVQLKNPTGGLQWIEPNSIQDWHIGRMLVEVAQEITNDVP